VTGNSKSMKTSIKLNKGQLDLLGLVVKYRFVSVGQIQRYMQLSSRTSINKKLTILINAGYLGMRYDNSYKFRHRPAAFYATPLCLKLLLETGTAQYITEKLIKASYKDKTATEQFIDDSWAIFDIALGLEGSYPGIQLYTMRQLASFDYLPYPLPELYIVRKDTDETKRYFLIRFAANKPGFTLTNRIKQLVAYAEDGSWDITGNEFPVVLGVCDTPGIERLVQRTTRRAISQSSELLELYTSSTKSVIGLNPNNTTIWTAIDNPGELLKLN
jgi:hypothetical protein